MKLSENRPLARAVLALTIAACFLLSGGGALSRQRNAALDAFYGEGGIGGDLTQRAQSAQLLAELGKSYGADEQSVARVEAAADTSASQSPILQRGAANKQLTLAADALYTELTQKDLPEADADYAFRLYKEIQSRAQIIARSGYDALAEAYNRRIGQFPANLLAILRGLGELDRFG